MKPSRRNFGALLMGGLMASAADSAASAAPRSAYPALGRLAQLLPDLASCRRLAEAGLAAYFDRTTLTQLDRAIAASFAAGKTPAEILQAYNAADFHAGRTLTLGGFVLARTEAAAALLRAHPNAA